MLDLRGLNRFLKVMPFRVLCKADVLQSMTLGDWYVSIDLKDVYFHVPTVRRHKQFLRVCLSTLDLLSMRAFLSQERVEDSLHLARCFQWDMVLKYGLILKLRGMVTTASMVVPLGIFSLPPISDLDQWSPLRSQV